MSEPRVSIILLNWNGGALVRRAYQAARAQDWLSLEIVLVDNASSDGSLEALLADAEPDHLIRLKRNLGFAAGMNAGLAVADGDWLLPLGSDVFLPPDYVATCVRRGERDPRIGAIAGKEYAWVDGELTDRPRRSAGALYLTGALRGRWIATDQEMEAFGVSGSIPLMRRAMLDDMLSVHGYLYDERFGTGYEDLDLWFRMRHRGWSALFLPQARAWHVGSASAGGASGFRDKPPDYQRRLFRNRRLIWMKDVTPGMRRRIWPRWRLFECLMPFYFLATAPRTLLSWWRGLADARQMAPAMAAENRRVAETALVPESDLLRFID